MLPYRWGGPGLRGVYHRAGRRSDPLAPSGLRRFPSYHVDSIRQLIAAGFGPREMRLKHLRTQVDCRKKALGDAAAAHVSGERVDSSLPLRLRHACRYALVGNDAGIALRQGDEDQNAGAILLAP